MWCLNQSKTKNNALKSFLDFINLKENVFKLKKIWNVQMLYETLINACI